ncbi:hypothetical protein GCM10009119_24810 [Algoriphagus jejuensis]|uniref:Lipoprotein n=1 Tax=Algoriphagus jejuensis TaxID=419934 RepID=A0ABP3YEJ3_9BACT
MKKQLFILCTLLLLGACSEEVDKDINTDLTQESSQFFKLSEAIGESAYLGNLSYSDYLRITSAELPGCPTIVPIPDTRIIELVYPATAECEQPNQSIRNGKIILDFTLSETDTPTWTLAYEVYFFEKNRLDGIRHFSAISASANEEVFENLKVVLENQLTFVASGAQSYSWVRSGNYPSSLTTRGKIDGRNPAGRDFSMVTTTAKVQQFDCYRLGWELPQTGTESWIVSRSISSSISYSVSFQSGTTCDPIVISTLPDGRNLQLNP